jgi:tRNA1(Val) A37 N6-methylase TrmN6
MSLDQPTDFVKHQTATIDAFLDGRLLVSQPRHGFRAGLDSVILGASVALASASVLDLGAGVGVAAMVALSHVAGRRALLVDSDEESLALARRNLAANDMADRADVVALDVTAKGDVRETAGLAREAYASVIANPPYFAADAGTKAGHAGRAAARHGEADALDLWVRTAVAHTAPGGEVVFIHRAEALPALLAAFGARLGALTVLPLAPRAGEPASRVLVRGLKGSRAPLRLLAARSLHGDEGRGFAAGFEAIFRGQATLVW